ncbi:MAG TPA: hypothetical protein PK177_20540 [Burkholderiaceae bacterium]|nr:hypothetical protein [Burkholderiaceae bacterium]
MNTPFVSKARHKPPSIAVATIVGALSWAWLPAHAAGSISPPACAAMAEWAAKFDRNDEWQPSPIGNRHRFARLFADQETTKRFGKPMVSWTESDVQAVRDAVLGCRRETKDRDLSGRYNQIQSALSSRVSNFAKAVGPAREQAKTSMDALAAMPPSPGLLRLIQALADAGSPDGYRKFQQVAGSLPPPAMQAAAPARGIANAIVHLTSEDIAGIVTTPAGQAASGMRKSVLDQMVADLGKTPADPDGLAALQRAQQSLAKDYAEVFAPAEREQIGKAIQARHAAIGDEITGAVIAELGKSSTGLDDAFADIERRSAPQLAKLLSPAQAARIRAAADARRNAVAEPMFTHFSAELARLPEDETSLQRIDATRDAIDNWPPIAGEQAPRFRKAADDRRAALLTVLNRKDAGPMAGRVYHSPTGREKLEFVDGKRVLITSGDHTVPASYVEEKDGRVSITGENMAVTLAREGRGLRGWTTPFTRAK